MESIDPANLKDVNKGFNKPGEYAAVLRAAGETQRLRHHVIHLWHGQRHRRRRRAHARADSHLAAGPAHLRPADAVARNAALQAPGSRRPPHAPQTLAGIHPLRDGAHAAEDDHRRSSRRSELRMGPLLQPAKPWRTPSILWTTSLSAIASTSSWRACVSAASISP